MVSTAYRFDIPIASVLTPHRVEFEVSKSRFMAWTAHCPTSEEAQTLLRIARTEHPNANHHCLAFIAGPPGEQTAIGFSDDGEPGGTAGRPIYQVLEGSAMGQIGCVVIRYFGGIKLGTGGLVRAYTKAALLSLESLPRQPYISRKRLLLLTDFSDEHEARQWSEQQGALISGVDYRADGALLNVEWPSDRAFDINALSLVLRAPARCIE